jgi:acetyl-CoA synthetase
MLMTLWKDEEKYQNTYWRKFSNNVYFTGDYALCDTDGYLWLPGRSDDVLKWGVP